MSNGYRGTARPVALFQKHTRMTVLSSRRTLADQILACLKQKTQRKYPPTAVLIVNCVPNTLIYDSEWNEAVERVRSTQAQFGFAEVFLLEFMGFHSATLYGKTGAQQRRRSK